jgi:hypothetical protein
VERSKNLGATAERFFRVRGEAVEGTPDRRPLTRIVFASLRRFDLSTRER